MRRSRQEILELFQTCQAKLGRTPGAPAFYKTAGVKNSEVLYYWPSHSALAKEAGGQPNKFKGRLDDSVVLEVVLITARALMHKVEQSIRDRSTFSLSQLATELFGNKIISS